MNNIYSATYEFNSAPIEKEKKIKKQQDNNASFEGISEVEFNKRHMKALKDAEPSGQKKRMMRKRK